MNHQDKPAEDAVVRTIQLTSEVASRISRRRPVPLPSPLSRVEIKLDLLANQIGYLTDQINALRHRMEQQ